MVDIFKVMGAQAKKLFTPALASSLVLLGLFSPISITPALASDIDKAQIAQLERPTVSPSELYASVWEIIKKAYYDQTFNNQDWNRWAHRYDGKLKTSDDAYKAIETMLASLADPYTRFLDPSAFNEEKQQIEAKLTGVGMQLAMNKQLKVVVVSPIENTPAFNAGIQAGDEILEIDTKPIKGRSLDEVVRLIRGKKDTRVAITMLRGTERKKFLLTRADISIKAVAHKEILPGNIGYIRLESFISKQANEEMRQALKDVEKADGLILDLRVNPGGLLNNATDIASMFIDPNDVKEKTIVSTIDAEGYKSPIALSGGSDVYKKPMVILINHGSASASEILSGCLHDLGRAKLIGQKSFGKGLVQAINRLDGGSGVNVTIARYLTPNDTDIHKSGISPDYEVKVEEKEIKEGKGPWWIDITLTNFKKNPADGKDIQLQKAISVLKDEIGKQADKTPNTANAKVDQPPAQTADQ